jgi:hypothetical protein
MKWIKASVIWLTFALAYSFLWDFMCRKLGVDLKDASTAGMATGTVIGGFLTLWLVHKFDLL